MVRFIRSTPAFEPVKESAVGPLGLCRERDLKPSLLTSVVPKFRLILCSRVAEPMRDQEVVGEGVPESDSLRLGQAPQADPVEPARPGLSVNKLEALRPAEQALIGYAGSLILDRLGLTHSPAGATGGAAGLAMARPGGGGAQTMTRPAGRVARATKSSRAAYLASTRSRSGTRPYVCAVRSRRATLPDDCSEHRFRRNRRLRHVQR